MTGPGRASRLWEWWTDELLPEVKDHLAYWESIDPGTLSMRQLLDHLDETLQRLTRLWDIHFQIAFPFLVAPSMFEELYAELFGGGGLDSYRLTQGFGNKTVEGGHALWRLSRRAIESEQVRSALQDSTGSDLFDKLATSSEGEAFSAEFRAFLDEWGQRSDVFAELGNPNWIEDPTTPIKNLKDFITEPDRDLASELSGLAAERERLTERAREQLNDHPQEARDRFEGLLKAAQAGTVLQEDHNHWIDQRGTYKVRQVILEFGNRFVDAGVIAEPNDVFYLTPDELRAVAENIVGDDRRQIVAARKSDIEASRNMATPEAFGTRPSGPPPDDPLGRAIGHRWPKTLPSPTRAS